MKILVVDDDATNRMVLKGLLEREAHDIITAENGQEAVDKFNETQPDMVLMDIMMPVMDGYDATRLIKQACGDRFVPVMFLTAMSGDEALVSCIENGGDDFLKKPYNRTILNAKIAALQRIRDLYVTVNEQNTELAAHQEHTMREHEVAEKIFANVMSKADQHLPMVRTVRRSAEAFNGDIVLAARNPSGGVNVLVGDFTGHGLAAAIGAMPVADVFYKMTAKGFAIDDIVPEINRKLRQLLPVGRFLAAALMNVDSQCRSMSIWAGGMPDVLVYDSKQKKIMQHIPSQHVPLGVLTPTQISTQTSHISIEAGQKIYIYSDGVTESENRQGEMYGQSRLENLICTRNGITDILVEELDRFSEGEKQADDITLVEFDCDTKAMLALLEHEDQMRYRDPTTWRMHFDLEHDVIKSVDPLPILMQILSDLQGFHAHREDIFTVLSELYNNALDHGVLGLSSEIKNQAEGFSEYYQQRAMRLSALNQGCITIALEHRPGTEGGHLLIRFTDSGTGFDTDEIQVNMEENKTTSGRGISLVRKLCSDVRYLENGNVVEAVLNWRH